MADDRPVRLDRTGYRLEFEDDFEGRSLDRTRWLPHYLPQWSSRAASAARFDMGDSLLRLRIDRDQRPWCQEWDGAVRVSSLQTGVFAGPLGSPIGQHRFAPGVVVREAQEPMALYTPLHGLIECSARAVVDPANMVALWMIGYEDRPERSAEICIFEIFGRDVFADITRIGMGVHPFGDPTIDDDFERVSVELDAGEFHAYAAEWTPERVRFFVDEEQVHEVAHSPAYPMQLMLNVYEFASGPAPTSPADSIRRSSWWIGSAAGGAIGRRNYRRNPPVKELRPGVIRLKSCRGATPHRARRRRAEPSGQRVDKLLDGRR